MIERIWFTESGYRAIVLFTRNGHRCGYVEIPQSHSCYEKEYSDVDVTVHGGLTFSAYGEDMSYGKSEGFWVLGFDCLHCDDARDSESYERYSSMGYIPNVQENISSIFDMIFTDGVVRTLDFVVAECESLATQLKEMDLRSN